MRDLVDFLEHYHRWLGLEHALHGRASPASLARDVEMNAALLRRTREVGTDAAISGWSAAETEHALRVCDRFLDDARLVVFLEAVAIRSDSPAIGQTADDLAAAMHLRSLLAQRLERLVGREVGNRSADSSDGTAPGAAGPGADR